MECVGLQVSCAIVTAATSGLVDSIFSTGKTALSVFLKGYSRHLDLDFFFVLFP